MEDNVKDIGEVAENETSPVKEKDKKWSYEDELSPTTGRYRNPGTRYLKKDAEDYQGYDIVATSDLDWDWQRANNQSVAAQIGGFITQAVAGEIIGGTLEGFGTIWQIGADVTTEMQGENAKFTNDLMDAGESIRDWGQKVAPIYRTNPNEAFDVGDFGWWASNAVSIASTVGIMIPGLGIVKGVGMLAKLLNIAKTMGKTAKMLSKAGLSAAVMRNAENLKESLQTTVQVRNEALDKFKSTNNFKNYLNSDEGKKVATKLIKNGKEVTPEAVADYVASAAGWRSYQVNAVNIASDFMQMLPIFRLGKGLGNTRAGALISHSNKVLKKQAEVLGKEAVKRSFGGMVLGTARALTKPGTIATETIGEGVEEIVNAIGGKEGLRYGHMLLNNASNEEKLNLAGRLNEYMRDGHIWEQAMWGAVGGLMFAGGARIANNKSMKQRDGEAISAIGMRQAQVESLTTEVLNTLNNNTVTKKDKYDNTVKDEDGNDVTISVEEAAKADNMSVDDYKQSLIRKSMDKSLRIMGMTESKTGTMDLLEEDIKSGNIGKLIDNIAKETGVDGTTSKYLSKSYMLGELNKIERLYNKGYNKFITDKNERPEIAGIVLDQYVNTELDINKAEETISDLDASISEDLNDNLIKQHKAKDIYFDTKLDNYGKFQVLRHYKDELQKLQLRAKKLGIEAPQGMVDDLTEKINNIESETANSIVEMKTAKSDNPATKLSEVTNKEDRVKLEKEIDSELNKKSLNVRTSELLNKGVGMNTLQKIVDKELTNKYKDEMIKNLNTINSSEYMSKIAKDIDNRAKQYKENAERIIDEYFNNITNESELGTVEEVITDLSQDIPTISDFEEYIQKRYTETKERIVINKETEKKNSDTEKQESEEVEEEDTSDPETDPEKKKDNGAPKDTGNITFNHADGFGINSVKLWNNLPASVLTEFEKAINEPDLSSVPYGYAVALFDIHYSITDDEVNELINLTKPQIYDRLQKAMSSIKEGDNGRDVALVLRAMVPILNINNLEFPYSNLTKDKQTDDNLFSEVSGSETVNVPKITLISDIRHITKKLNKSGYSVFNYRHGKISSFNKQFIKLYNKAINKKNRTTEEYNAVRLVEIYDSLHSKDSLNKDSDLEIRLHAINNNLPPELQDYAKRKNKTFTTKYSAEYIEANTRNKKLKEQWLKDAFVEYTDDNIAYFVKHTKFDILHNTKSGLKPNGMHMASLIDYSIASDISQSLNNNIEVSSKITNDDNININDFKIRYYKSIKQAELANDMTVMAPAFEFLIGNNNRFEDIKGSLEVWNNMLTKNIELLNEITADMVNQMKDGVGYNWIKIKGFKIFNKSRASYNYTHGVENNLEDVFDISKDELKERIVIIGKKGQRIIENKYLNEPITTNNEEGFKQGIYMVMSGDNVDDSPRLVKLTTRSIQKQFSKSFSNDFNKILEDISNTDVNSEDAINILAREIEDTLSKYAVIHQYQISSKDTNFLGFKVNRHAYTSNYGKFIDLIEFSIYDTDDTYIRTRNDNFVHLEEHKKVETKYKIISYSNGNIALVENNNFKKPLALITSKMSKQELKDNKAIMLEYLGRVKSSIDFSNNNLDVLNMPRGIYLQEMENLVANNIDKIVTNIRPITLPNGRKTIYDMSTSDLANKVNIQITNVDLNAITPDELNGDEQEVIDKSKKDGQHIEEVKINSFIDIETYKTPEDVVVALSSKKAKTVGSIIDELYGDISNSKYAALYNRYRDLKITFNGTSSKFAMQYKIGKNGQPNRIIVHGGLMTLHTEPGFNSTIATMLTHELIHATINDSLFTDKIKERLAKIQTKLNQPDIKAYFEKEATRLGVDNAQIKAILNSSVEEMLTYAYTNSTIASILNNIGSTTSNKSILSDILSVIADLLNMIGVNHDSIMSELHSITKEFGLQIVDSTIQTEENINENEDISEDVEDIKLPDVEDIPLDDSFDSIDFDFNADDMFAVVDGITPIIQNDEIIVNITPEEEATRCAN